MYVVKITSYAYRKVKKLNKENKALFDSVVEKLKVDPFDSTLKTHKLKGKLNEEYSCRLNYKDRVLFIFIEKEIITIIDIGSHDEVY